MVDSTYLVEVYRPQQKKKLPNAQKNRVGLALADLGALAGAGHFVAKTGDTMSGPLIVDQNVAGIKARLAMVLPGTQQDAPTTLGIASTYLGIGGGEWNVNSYRLIGFGYISAVGDQYPAFVGYEETVKTDHTRGDLVFGTRPVNTNTVPTIVLRIDSAGQIKAENPAYAPAAPGSLTNKGYVDTEVAKAIPLTQKGAANGVATLDPSGKVPASELNVSGLAYKGDWNASTNTPTLANGTGVNGDFYKVSVAGSQNLGAGADNYAVGDWVMYDGAVWDRFGAHEAVASVNGKTGVVVLVKADVGLGNVDNTSDVNKPVSTATQTALNAKANAADLTTHIANVGAAAHLPAGGTPGQIPIKGAGTAVAWGNVPDASVIQAPQFTTAGGNVIPAGTIASQLKAIGDLADPA